MFQGLEEQAADVKPTGSLRYAPKKIEHDFLKCFWKSINTSFQLSSTFWCFLYEIRDSYIYIYSIEWVIIAEWFQLHSCNLKSNMSNSTWDDWEWTSGPRSLGPPTTITIIQVSNHIPCPLCSLWPGRRVAAATWATALRLDWVTAPGGNGWIWLMPWGVTGLPRRVDKNLKTW